MQEDWIDYNGHLNMAYYNVIFDHGVDHFFDLLNIGAAYAASGVGSCFSLEVHCTTYRNLTSDQVEVRLQLLDYDQNACTAKKCITATRISSSDIRTVADARRYDQLAALRRFQMAC